MLVHTKSRTDVVGVDKDDEGKFRWNCRTGVHEYGGAAAAVFDGVVYFSNFGDGSLCRTSKTKEGGFGAPTRVPRELHF